ncbi:MAG: hypothetical protein AB7P21_25765 [Lautropia sp.]
MKASPIALGAALLLAGTAVLAQPGKLPDDNQQRGEQMIPRDVMPPERAKSPSPPKSDAQKRTDSLEQQGEQNRPAPTGRAPSSGPPTTMTESERQAARTKERGEQMRPMN